MLGKTRAARHWLENVLNECQILKIGFVSKKMFCKYSFVKRSTHGAVSQLTWHAISFLTTKKVDHHADEL